MKYVWIVILIGLCILPVLLRNYEKQWLQKQKIRKDILFFIYPVGLWLFDFIRKRKGSDEEQEEWARAVYTGKSPSDQLRLRCAGKLRMAWIGAVAAAAVGAALSGIKSSETEAKTELARPEFGETVSYELQVDGLTDTTESFSVSVAGQEPEGSQMQEVFDTAWEHVKEVMKGNNASLEEVREKLELPAVTDYGIRVEWKSEDSDLVSSSGEIMAKEIPEEGVIAGLLATLSYASESAIYEIYVRIFPPKKDKAYFIKMFEKLIKQQEKETRGSDRLVLPDELEGKKLTYSERKKKKPWWIVPLLFAAGVTLVAADRQNLKKEYEERNRALSIAYPSFVFKLSLMLGCGLNLRSAWERMIEGYVRQQKEKLKKEKKVCYLYEEMIITQNRIRAGEGEAAAYRAFGQVCKEDCYLRLGSYLEQNIRQGVSGMQKMLEEEMTQSLEERRNLALRMGEELNTKLLLPMFLMLGVVVAVLMAPAILSM